MLEAGRKIGPYVLEQALGEGSYGVVWLAHERTGLIERHVALKLPKDAEPDLEAIRREAAVWLSAGKHHNIVQVLHADIYDGQVAIATEYISGGSLQDRLRREPKGLLPVPVAVEMTRGILGGLQHLHALPPKPLVHRDLKPGNVLLRGDIPLLTDFGLTRAFSSTVMTQAGGTPGYMPPEAFDDRFSPQTDIWAAGVTLYRMLKGELPFPQRDLSALIGGILHREPEPLPDFVPKPIVAVIFKALMKDPDRRFASAAEMEAALELAMEERGASFTIPATLLEPIPPIGLTSSPVDFDIRTPSGSAGPLVRTAIDSRPPEVPGLDIGAHISEYGAPPAPQGVADRRPEAPRAPAAFAVSGGAPAVPALEYAVAAARNPVEPAALRPTAGAGRPTVGVTDSEALTALPEALTRPRGPAQRLDSLLRYLGADSTRFCCALLGSIPIWTALGTVGQMLVKAQILGTVSGLLFTSGIMSVLFARLAWHRYHWKPESVRRNVALRYGVLGVFSGAVVPVVAMAIYVAIASATASPSETPAAGIRTEIEPRG